MLVAGCSDDEPENGEVNPQLDLFAEIEKEGTDWELTVRVRHTSTWETSVHDVTVVAFSDTGEQVCEKHIGDFVEMGAPERTVTTNCDEFPAIIAVTAQESPCEGAYLEILYWIGTDEQRKADLPGDVLVWESYYRECNEDLPPQRALENVSRSEANNQAES